MDALLTALADPARWRLVSLLAERPRSVGVLAQLSGARQPQTTKHLQTLERAGVVASQRTGQRRIYALQPGPLRDLAAALSRLADTADRAGSPRETYDRYGLSVHAERLAAEESGWADDRSFTFRRSLTGSPEQVWRHLTEPILLARWWAPDDLRVSELVFEARPGGRVVLEYRDAEDADGSDLVAGRAEGVVDEVRPGERLAYRFSPLLPDGGLAFTAHVDLGLRPTDNGTDLDVRYRITDSTVDSADFVAGIEIGFGQSLDKLAAILAADPSATNEHRARHRHKEHEMTEQTGGRRVVTNMSLSLDGHYAAADPRDMSWVMPYAVGDVARDHLTSLWEPATTALLGRVNAEGFLGFWPTVIGMEGADPRDEGFAKWLVDTEKVVLSSTLGKPPWERTTIVDRPTVEVVADLRVAEGGDIVVLSSASVIKALLAADQVDRLALMVFPIFLGEGPRLFDDGLPAGSGRSSARPRASTASWPSSTTGSAESVRGRTGPAPASPVPRPGGRAVPRGPSAPPTPPAGRGPSGRGTGSRCGTPRSRGRTWSRCGRPRRRPAGTR